MERAHEPNERDRPKSAPTRAPTAAPVRENSEQRELLELQRTAGNRAVTGALTTIQRHHLDPEAMPEE